MTTAPNNGNSPDGSNGGADGMDRGGARAPDYNLPGPLNGLRVLEICDEKGQFCGKLMADLGADLIKVEPPGGEPCRNFGPFLDDIPHRERSLSFWHYNTSKRGITLNLETLAGAGHPQTAGGRGGHCAGKPAPRLAGIPGAGLLRPGGGQRRADYVFPDALRANRPLAGLYQQRHYPDGRRRADGVLGL